MSATIPMPAAVAAPPVGNAMQKLLDFLARLGEYKHQYRLSCHREEAVMVELAVPGERWEIEFFANGTVEVERFRSDGRMADDAVLNELFTTYA